MPKAIMMDTDSVYMNFEDVVPEEFDYEKSIEFVEYVADGFCQTVINRLMDNIDTNMNTLAKGLLKADREIISPALFVVSKKKYAALVTNNEGVKFDPPDLKIQGLDAVKSSLSEKVRDVIKAYYRVLLEKSPKEANEKLLEFKEEFNNLNPEEISFNTSVNEIKKYINSDGSYKSGTIFNSKAAITHNRFIKERKLTAKIKEIKEGDKIKIVFLKEPNIVHEPTFAWNGTWEDDFSDLEKYIDYDRQFYKIIGRHIDLVNAAIGFEPSTVEELDLM